MTTPKRKTIELFYDVVSPYSWIAFEVMIRYKTKWNIDLNLKPFLIGAIKQGAGNQQLGLAPNQFNYFKKDIAMLRKYYGVPMIFPSDVAEVMFNKGSLSAQRFLTAIDMQQPDKTEELSRQLWMRIWNKDEDITLESSFREAGEKAGLSVGVLEKGIKGIKVVAVKDRLKEYNKQALDYGVSSDSSPSTQDRAFGGPTIIAHVNNKREMVFGSDRFPQLAMILGQGAPGMVQIIQISHSGTI